MENQSRRPSNSKSNIVPENTESASEQIKNQWPMFSTKKSVPLLGGYDSSLGDIPLNNNNDEHTVDVVTWNNQCYVSPLSTSSSAPRIQVLPTSYTDLYAELSR